MPMSWSSPRSSLLEWGHLTDEPGSRVFDAVGGMVFSTSQVCSLANDALFGVVLRLTSEVEIVVQWLTDDLGVQHLSPEEIRVVVPLPFSS